MKKQQSISKWATKISQQQTQVESAVPQERNSNEDSVCESRKQGAAVEHAEVVKPSLPQVEDKLSVTDLLKQNQPKNISFLFKRLARVNAHSMQTGLRSLLGCTTMSPWMQPFVLYA